MDSSNTFFLFAGVALGMHVMPILQRQFRRPLPSPFFSLACIINVGFAIALEACRDCGENIRGPLRLGLFVSMLALLVTMTTKAIRNIQDGHSQKG